MYGLSAHSMLLEFCAQINLPSLWFACPLLQQQSNSTVPEFIPAVNVLKIHAIRYQSHAQPLHENHAH